MYFRNNSKQIRVKKILSALIISMMMVSVLPTNAFAVDTTPPGFTATTVYTYYNNQSIVEINIYPDEPLQSSPSVSIYGNPAVFSTSDLIGNNGNGIYTYQIDMSQYSMPDGTADIMVTGTDVSNNTNLSPVDAGNFIVDSMPPNAPTNLHIIGDTINYSNQNALVIEGNAEPNSLISLNITDNHGHDNSTLPPWETQTNDQGIFSITINNLADVGLDESNIITLSAMASDLAGNNGGIETLNNILKDTVIPTAPINLNISNLENGKIVNTNQNELHIIGTATTDGTIEVTLNDGNGHIISGNQPNVSENQNFDIPLDVSALDNTTNITVTANCVDVAGNISDVNPTITVEKNVTPPNFNLTVSPNPAKAGIVNITATPNENLITAPEISIEGLSNGVMADGNLDGTYEYAYNVLPNTNGDFNIIVTGYDLDGNIGTGSTILTTDTVAPSISGITTTNKTITTDAIINFTLSEDANVAVQILDGIAPIRTINLGAMNAGAATPVHWNGKLDDGSTFATDGSYNIKIIATDAAVNVGTDTSVSLILDRTAPGISGVATSPMTITTDAMINFTLNEDADITLEILSGLTPIRTINLGAISAGTQSVQWNGKLDDGSTFATDGSYNIKITAADLLGNIAINNGSNVVKSTVTPTTPGSLTVVGGSITNLNYTNLHVTGTALNGTIVTVTLSDGNGHLLNGSQSISDGTFDIVFNTSSLNDTNINISAVSADLLGNQSAVSTISVDKNTIPPGDNTPPPTPWNVVLSDNKINSSNKSDIHISGDTEVGSIVNVILTDSSGHSQLNNQLSLNGRFVLAFDTANLADGNVNIVISATDLAGNASSNKLLSVSKDTFAPTFNIDLSNEVITEGSISIILTVNENLAAPPTLSIGLNGGNKVNLSNPIVAGNKYEYSYEVSKDTPNGNVTIDVEGVDLTGNQGTATTSFVIDNSCKTPTLEIPEDKINYDNQQLLHLIGTSDIGSSVIANLTDTTGKSIHASMNSILGTYDISVSPIDLKDGDIVISIVAIDSLGNISLPIVKTIQKDTIKPVISNVKLRAGVFSPTINKNTITYNLSEEAKVTVKIYDNKSRILSTLLEEASSNAGVNTVSWSGKTSFGIVLPNGIYKYEITAKDMAGNSSTRSAGMITIDNSGPILSYITSLNSSKYSYIRIKWNQNESAYTTIKMFNSKNKLVKVLHSSSKNKGSYNVYWYYKESKKKSLKGNYYYQIISEDKSGNITKYTSDWIKIK